MLIQTSDTTVLDLTITLEVHPNMKAGREEKKAVLPEHLSKETMEDSGCSPWNSSLAKFLPV